MSGGEPRSKTSTVCIYVCIRKLCKQIKTGNDEKMGWLELRPKQSGTPVSIISYAIFGGCIYHYYLLLWSSRWSLLSIVWSQLVLFYPCSLNFIKWKCWLASTVPLPNELLFFSTFILNATFFWSLFFNHPILREDLHTSFSEFF